jgi:hypothetical protein
MIGVVGATVSFEEGSGLLKELAGLHVVAKQVERTAESLGAEVAQDKRRHIWSAESRDEEGLPIRDPGSVTYSAAIQSAAAPDNAAQRSEFAERVLRKATRRGFDPRQRTSLHDHQGYSWAGRPPGKTVGQTPSR